MAKLPFDHCAGDYGRYRPAYPAEVVELVHRFAPQGMVADVGAGTGIFTRALAKTGRSIVALDPSAAMLGRLSDSAGSTSIARVCAPAERLPLAAGKLAAVACAQAFHWCDPQVALDEFARVLCPRGLLLLVWNNRDTADPFVDAFENLVARYNPAYRREYRDGDWKGLIDASGRFGPVEARSLKSTWALSQDDFVGFTRSVSYIRNVLTAADQFAFDRDLRDLLHRHAGSGPCKVPLNTLLWWTLRRD